MEIQGEGIGVDKTCLVEFLRSGSLNLDIYCSPGKVKIWNSIISESNDPSTRASMHILHLYVHVLYPLFTGYADM